MAAFASTLSAGFVADDHRAIEGNPAFERGLGAVLRNDYWGADKAGTWRPLPQASLFADARLWSMRPGGFHLTNAVLHGAVCAILVLALGGGPAAFGPGLLAAVLAPGAEGVQAIVGRADLLLPGRGHLHDRGLRCRDRSLPFGRRKPVAGRLR